MAREEVKQESRVVAGGVLKALAVRHNPVSLSAGENKQVQAVP